MFLNRYGFAKTHMSGLRQFLFLSRFSKEILTLCQFQKNKELIRNICRLAVIYYCYSLKLIMLPWKLSQSHRFGSSKRSGQLINKKGLSEQLCQKSRSWRICFQATSGLKSAQNYRCQRHTGLCDILGI